MGIARGHGRFWPQGEGMLSQTCMRCPYKRLRKAKHTRFFAVGEQPGNILQLRLCEAHKQLFDREFNAWIEQAEVVSIEFARVNKLRTANCMRCTRSRAGRAEHTRVLLVGEDPRDVCRIRLCESHVEQFDIDFDAWSSLADIVELQPATARALRSTGSTFGDDSAIRIRALKERAASRLQEVANDDTTDEVRLGPRTDEWRFSLHAQQRAEERNFSPAQVLRAASSPTTTAPTTGKNAGPDLFYHVNGGVCAVVNVRQRIILTVYEKFEYLCQISRGSTPARKGIA